MAQEYQARDIMTVIDALTNLFRIGLSKGKESIKVSEEIEHIRSYLIIQMNRYEDKFDYDIEVQEEAKKTFFCTQTHSTAIGRKLNLSRD
ncbi:hypothetical protein GCM10020331_099150 [Ectobacillus funiculus]